MQRFGDRLGRLFRHVMAAGNCVSLAIGRPLGPQAQQRALQGPPLSSVGFVMKAIQCDPQLGRENGCAAQIVR